MSSKFEEKINKILEKLDKLDVLERNIESSWASEISVLKN
jgi:hypothetical protein